MCQVSVIIVIAHYFCLCTWCQSWTFYSSPLTFLPSHVSNDCSFTIFYMCMLSFCLLLQPMSSKTYLNIWRLLSIIFYHPPDQILLGFLWFILSVLPGVHLQSAITNNFGSSFPAVIPLISFPYLITWTSASSSGHLSYRVSEFNVTVLKCYHDA